MMVTKTGLMLSLSLLSAACTIGNGHICGPQTPMVYCDKEAYDKLMDPRRYIEKWQKLGGTAASRDDDSDACGGGRGRYAPLIGETKIRAAQLAGESMEAARMRLHTDWQRCMVKKGYKFTGECYGIPFTPACGAP